MPPRLAVPGIGPSSGTPVSSLAVGRGYCAAIDREGGLWVWGAMPQHGALGLGEHNGSKIKSARQPTRVDALDGRFIVQAAAGAAHIVAIADSRLSSTAEMAVPAEARFGTTSQQDYDHAMCDSCEREDGPEGGALLFCDWCAEPRARHTRAGAPPLSLL